MTKNPALSQEARYEPAKVIALKQEASLIDWLRSSGRLIPREKNAQESVVKTSGVQDDVEVLLEDELEDGLLDDEELPEDED